MKKHPIRKIILLSIVGYILFLAYQHYFPNITNSESTGANIIALGDSLTEGYLVSPDECYVSLVQRQLGMPVINAGVNGNNSADALERLKADVLDKNPRLVILAIGGNDLLQQTPRKQTIANVASMIRQIQESGAAVILVGVASPLFGPGLSSDYKKLSGEFHTGIIANIMSGIMTRPSLMADRVHPNAKGHKIMAARIAKEIRRCIHI